MLVGLFVFVLLVGGGLAWYFFLPPKEVVKSPKEQESPVFAEHVASYSEDGVVSLYKVESGAKLDKVDLKTKTTKKEKTVEMEESTLTKTEDCKCIDESTNEKVKVEVKTEGNMYKGYEMVSKTIQKGQNIWNIQSELTPHINTIKMLPLLQEVNKGKSLHPVQPNETRIFLKEPTRKGEVPKEEPTQTPSNKVTKKTVTKKVEDSTFIYYADSKNKTLYAYSKFANEVYKLTIKEDKWSVETIASFETKREADWLYVDGKKIWLADESHTHIQVFDIQNPKKIVEWDTKGIMSKWHIDGQNVYYTYDNRMTSEQLGKGEINDVVLGDATLDFVYVKDKFYVLNSFGKNTDNSLLMKVNPKELKVDDLIELKSNETAILSHGEEGQVYIGKIEKTKGLDGKTTEIPKVVSIDVTDKTLKEQSMKWELVFSPNMQGWNNHLYVIENKQLQIYPTGESKPVKEFGVDAPGFSLLP